MLDKYSKLEDKIEEGRRRLGFIENVVKKGFGGEFLSWEIKGMKLNAQGLRVNITEIKCESSNVRYMISGKLGEMQKSFEENFLDSQGQKEKIVFRVR